MTASLRVALLGPLEVWRDSDPVVLSSNRLRTLLAVLAMSAGETVSLEQLAFALWTEGAPANERRSVQTYISRLRHDLGTNAIRTTPEGYRLDVEPDRVDALRFRRLLHDAASARGTSAERELLKEALALWRGRPFDGVESTVLRASKATRLEELRLSAVERWIDLELADGRHRELVAEVQELAAGHPLREPLWGRLLLTLGRCGRQAEALAMYDRLRRRLAEDLGVDPSPELQHIHSALLEGDAWQTGLPAVPRQLPPGVADLAGRAYALKELDRLLIGGARICVITGTAGVGKTSLALHWAHRTAELFPDGQLYADLSGFGPAGCPTRAEDALSAFLHALGVPSHTIPDDLHARSALYRTMLAEKRMLVFLDNVRDAEQVRHLLPGGTQCTLLITSRRGLSSLVTAEGAALLTLDVLSREEARDLLARRLGRERVEKDSQATEEIVELCARLPLALAIAAGRAAATPSFPLSALAADLRRGRVDLAAFATRDTLADLRTVLSKSYDLLPPDAARLFRLLAVHPGPDITRPAIASLTAVEPSEADRLLDILLDAHLVTEVSPGRFAFHDLLRAYARGAGRPWSDRQAARRTIDHYVSTAYRAARLLEPQARLGTLSPPAPGTRPEPLEDAQQAADWFRAEHSVLLAVLRQATTQGLRSHAVRLSAAMAVWREPDTYGLARS